MPDRERLRVQLRPVLRGSGQDLQAILLSRTRYLRQSRNVSAAGRQGFNQMGANESVSTDDENPGAGIRREIHLIQMTILVLRSQ